MFATDHYSRGHNSFHQKPLHNVIAVNGIAVNGAPSSTSMASALTLHQLWLRVSDGVVGDKFELNLLMLSEEGKVEDPLRSTT